MAIGRPSGFAAFAARAKELIEVIATTPPPPPPPTPHELRAMRKAAKKAKRELAQATPDQFDFGPLTPRNAATDTANDLEQAMREALGLGIVQSEAKPEPKPEPAQAIVIDFIPHPFVSTAPSEARAEAAKLEQLQRETAKTLGLASKEKDTPKPKPRAPREWVKREFEVVLSVRNYLGMVVPFYHIDGGSSQVQAEINAAKKARGYGLTVIETSRIEIKETLIKADGAPRVSECRQSSPHLHA